MYSKLSQISINATMNNGIYSPVELPPDSAAPGSYNMCGHKDGQ